jgi:hypothetical protein
LLIRNPYREEAPALAIDRARRSRRRPALGPAAAEAVGSSTNEWTGKGILVEAIADPEIAGPRSPAARPGRS